MSAGPFSCSEVGRQAVEGIGDATVPYGVVVAVGGEQGRNPVDAQVGELERATVAVFQMATADDADHEGSTRAVERTGDPGTNKTVPGIIQFSAVLGLPF